MNALTKLIRSLLPFPLFRRFATAYSILRTFLDTPQAGYFLMAGSGVRTVHFRKLQYPFTFRLNDSDRSVVMQNIVRGECVGGPLPKSAAFIVDGGGYIGDSAAVFLSLYPKAVCHVIEPSSHADIAATNLAPYGERAILQRAMLARAPGSFTLIEDGTGTKALCSAHPNYAIKVMTISELLHLAPAQVIDILKLDIEGFELEILRPPTPWLASVRCVIVELHGEAASRNVPSWLRDAGFQLTRHRSLLFCNRLDTPQ